ncbi:hypothetical protein MNV49_003942 [Pseudohyphozyma bogoriensis]|nr:hypothetical protein MNV49_003942 [Pseudohyphozyma bogoriensis]
MLRLVHLLLFVLDSFAIAAPTAPQQLQFSDSRDATVPQGGAVDICPSLTVRCVKDGKWPSGIVGDIGPKPFKRVGIRCNQAHPEKNTRECNFMFAEECSGKTTIFTSLLRRLPPLIHPDHSAHSTKVLILVGGIQLAHQAAETVKRWYPYLSVEVEQGDNVASGHADVTVATYQTLARSDYSRLQKFDPNGFKAVIVDETHHAVAERWLNILSHFDPRLQDVNIEMDQSFPTIHASPISSAKKISSTIPAEEMPLEDPIDATIVNGRVCVPIFGFTATFSRPDGVGLGNVFQTIAWHADWLAMIKAGWLSDIKFTTVYLASVDLDAVKGASGDMGTVELAKLLDTQQINDIVVESWFSKAQDRRSTLVFAVNIAHVISLTNAFREAGIDARLMHNETPKDERRELLRAFRNFEFPVLINCAILTEGADIPNIDCVLIARPSRSKNLYLQMIGRGLRLSPGKQDCLILDSVGSKADKLVCGPTLFGLDSSFRLERQSAAELQELYEEEEEARPQPSSYQLDFNRDVKYRDYASVFDLIGTSHDGSRSIRNLSRHSFLAWVGVGDGAFILETATGHAKVAPASEEYSQTGPWIATWHEKTYERVKPPVVVSRGTDLHHVVSMIDSYVLKMPAPTYSLRRGGPWRKGPSTEAQRDLIATKLRLDPKDAQAELDGVWVGKEGSVVLAGLTRGEAGNVITRLVHGGKGFLKKVDKTRARDARLLAKAEKQAEKERLASEKKTRAREKKMGSLPSL